MVRICGKVRSGKKLSSKNFKKHSSRLKKHTGMKIYPGSLNVRLDFPVELINRIDCYKNGICPASLNGLKVYLHQHQPRNISILSSVNLRKKFGLKNGKRIIVEVEKKYIRKLKVDNDAHGRETSPLIEFFSRIFHSWLR